MCNAITTNFCFDMVVILLIFASTVTLAFEHPLEDPSSDKMQQLFKVDVALTCAFALEAFLKIITSGFWFNGKKSYLRDSWNMLDFSIVTVSLISLVIDADFYIVRVLRVVRILRPLRLIQRLEGLKVATLAFIKAIPHIMHL